MQKNQKCNDESSSRSIQLSPRYHPKKVEIAKLENGFTIELLGGEELFTSATFKKSLVAHSLKEVMKIAKGFLEEE